MVSPITPQFTHRRNRSARKDFITMKRTLSLLLCAAMALTLMAGCGPKNTTSSSSSASGSESSSQSSSASQSGTGGESSGFTQPKLMVLSGPTGVGAAKLMADWTYAQEHDLQTPDGGFVVIDSAEVVTDNTEVAAALTNGDADIAAIATNAAANLAAKTDGGIQILGVLYILEKGNTVQTMADLAGKTLYCPSNTKGGNPEHILNHLLEKNGVSPSDVDIQWLTPQEITAKLTSSDAGICMLPVPAATALMVQDSGVRQALSLSEEWENLGEGPLPMGCIVARTAYIEENPEGVAAFLRDYEESIAYMSDPDNLTDAAELVAQFGITPNAKVAEMAIPQCNLTFVTGKEMHTMLEDYYSILFQAAPDSIGGGLPYDSFYYGVG